MNDAEIVNDWIPLSNTDLERTTPKRPRVVAMGHSVHHLTSGTFICSLSYNQCHSIFNLFGTVVLVPGSAMPKNSFSSKFESIKKITVGENVNFDSYFHYQTISRNLAITFVSSSVCYDICNIKGWCCLNSRKENNKVTFKFLA